jgi:ribosomal protein S6--L-glutamate ligase
VPQLLERLRERDCTVDVWVPECQAGDLQALVPDADLYLWKSHGRVCDSIAAYLNASGRALLNDYFATMQVRDKFVTARRLLDAGLPTPEAFFADSARQLAEAVDRYPIVLKSNGGRRGQEVALARNVEELLELDHISGPLCAQDYLPGSGLDLKAYVIGRQVFAVWRPSPLAKNGAKERKAVQLSREVKDLCLRCGELFGLELYGVDLLETPDGPYIIEVNCFPGYKGVPDADRLLAAYILERARAAG